MTKLSDGEEKSPTPLLDVVQAMQKAAFVKDWPLFRSFFDDRVAYRVGNVEEVEGPESVAAYLRDLPASGLSITGMDVRKAGETESTAIAEYTMHARLGDGRVVEYPCVDIYRFRGPRFVDWRVYPIQSSFVQDSTKIDLSRGAPPSVAGKPSDRSRGTVDKFQAALRDGNRNAALSLLTDDAIVRVADQPEVRGPGPILDHIQDVFSRRLRPSDAQVLGVWEFDGAMFVEMIVQATRVSGDQAVAYPCVESYRFAGDKIREWRIYPIEATLLASHD